MLFYLRLWFCLRYCIGVIPVIRLKSLTKWLSSLIPTRAMISLTLRKVSTRSVAASCIRICLRYRAGGVPVSALNRQLSRVGERFTDWAIRLIGSIRRRSAFMRAIKASILGSICTSQNLATNAIVVSAPIADRPSGRLPGRSEKANLVKWSKTDVRRFPQA